MVRITEHWGAEVGAEDRVILTQQHVFKIKSRAIGTGVYVTGNLSPKAVVSRAVGWLDDFFVSGAGGSLTLEYIE